MTHRTAFQPKKNCSPSSNHRTNPTALDAYQQMLATDKLLEYAEISLRTLCDLIRYQQLKELGIVHSAKEFIQLFHSNEQEDTP